MKKICYISCYSRPNYTRRIQFVQALENSRNIEAVIIVNKTKSLFRYLIIIRLIWIRITKKIDVFVLGFRGNEIYLPIRVITLGKPLYFDAFVPFYNALVEENKWGLSNTLRTILGKLVYYYESLTLKLSDRVITDTAAHKKHYVEFYNLKEQNIFPIYLGCAGEISNLNFLSQQKNEGFTIFFYGTMQPLHGINLILEAANYFMNSNIFINFQIVGGNSDYIESFIEKNNLSNIEYFKWLEEDELFKLAQEADLCLGGPFGDTQQAKSVITGKTYQFLSLAKCTIVGLNSEILLFPFKDKYNCILVALGDIDNLIHSIDWAYNNQNLLGEIGLNGRNLYRKHFSREKLEANLLSIFKK